MKIIEGLKRLKLIEKRMASNQRDITEYASKLSTEKPKFSTDEQQKQEVKSLVQANHDLFTESLKLKNDVDFTNLTTVVEIGGVKRSIADLLMIKRKMAHNMLRTFEALNDTSGEQRLRFAQHGTGDGPSPHVERYYDEKFKLEGRRHWQDLYDNIDSRLEVINATEDLKTFSPEQG